MMTCHSFVFCLTAIPCLAVLIDTKLPFFPSPVGHVSASLCSVSFRPGPTERRLFLPSRSPFFPHPTLMSSFIYFPRSLFPFALPNHHSKYPPPPFLPVTLRVPTIFPCFSYLNTLRHSLSPILDLSVFSREALPIFAFSVLPVQTLISCFHSL